MYMKVQWNQSLLYVLIYVTASYVGTYEHSWLKFALSFLQRKGMFFPSFPISSYNSKLGQTLGRLLERTLTEMW
jgi:hypothetical protein